MLRTFFQKLLGIQKIPKKLKQSDEYEEYSDNFKAILKKP
jgi:hypothetical protein